AMKMENEIVASQDGTIASVDVAAGQSVEAGDILVTLN
ncbi:MAG TPA: acetyl-CoA carboxylase biotin carboxyl carrier protein subunit, partial [Lachnospiraceae bacterium]|nr:acetyl-CoA carboxylase biotin carboxyl carrier protein subunit [Lachnospiraceae bacterium]